VISRQGQEGRFRVVLYPFRTTAEPAGSRSREEWEKYPLGAALPAVSPPSAATFFLKFEDQKHEWTFTPAEDGRSRIVLQRGAERWRID
jgi:hypothetical protein